MSYEEFVRSNWGFISDEAQWKIRAARFMLAGCGLGSDTKPEEFFFNFVLKMASFLPGYLQQNVTAHRQAMEAGLSFPQLGIASNISSALMVTAMIKLTSGLPLDVAPIPLTLDCWQPFGSQSVQGESNAFRG